MNWNNGTTSFVRFNSVHFVCCVRDFKYQCLLCSHTEQSTDWCDKWHHSLTEFFVSERSTDSTIHLRAAIVTVSWVAVRHSTSVLSASLPSTSVAVLPVGRRRWCLASDAGERDEGNIPSRSWHVWTTRRTGCTHALRSPRLANRGDNFVIDIYLLLLFDIKHKKLNSLHYCVRATKSHIQNSRNRFDTTRSDRTMNWLPLQTMWRNLI